MDSAIKNRPESYTVDAKRSMVYKEAPDQPPLLDESASFAFAHNQRLHAQHVDHDDAQVIFNEWTPNQRAIAFVSAVYGERYSSLLTEYKYSLALDQLGWMSDNLRYGCL